MRKGGLEPTHVIVCGSRDWDDRDLMLHTLRGFVPAGATVYHGNARGADRIARGTLEIYFQDQTDDPSDDVTITPFPVTDEDWQRFGKAAGPRRNRQMLQTLLAHPGPKRVIAFYRGLPSRGTDDMIRRARAAGVETIVVYSQRTD